MRWPAASNSGSRRSTPSSTTSTTTAVYCATASCRKTTCCAPGNTVPECAGVLPPEGIWCHVCGSDLVRDADGTLYVLEDNLRVPSGVSYMLENRAVMKRVFPELFEHYGIHPVDDYPARLAACLRSLAPAGTRAPRIVVLTPGIHNSAYFEHAYLAQEMAADLVEGSDLHGGGRRLRVHEDHRGPGPRGRDLPPHR